LVGIPKCPSFAVFVTFLDEFFWAVPGLEYGLIPLLLSLMKLAAFMGEREALLKLVALSVICFLLKV
jgi:hypothetical protein